MQSVMLRRRSARGAFRHDWQTGSDSRVVSHQGQVARRHAAARRPELRPHGDLRARTPRRGRARASSINRPTDEELGEPLDRWDDLQARPAQVFAGGPVETDALIALALANSPLAEAERRALAGRRPRRLGRSLRRPGLRRGRVSAVRVFRGYAGWGPGQLEGEIMAGAWLVFDAEPDDVFAAAADRAVANRAAPPGRAARLACQRARRPQRELSLRSTRSATSACSAGTSRWSWW